jgi:predicted peptidase
MAKILSAAMVLMAATQAVGDEAIEPFEVHSYSHTGGPYQNEEFQYLVLKPKHVEPGKKYPLVLFLHGAGERGVNDMPLVSKHFPQRMASDEYREKFPCFLIVPQCRPNKRWVNADWGDDKSQKMKPEPSEQMKVAIAILKKSMEKYPVDKNRVYLTGLSMGGYGSWELAVRHPEWFAAVVPICGGGDETQAERLKNVPLWAVHGDADTAVPVERSRKMIAAIKAAGGHPKYTEYPGVGHNSWTRAYTDPNGVLPWMFEQARK